MKYLKKKFFYKFQTLECSKFCVKNNFIEQFKVMNSFLLKILNHRFFFSSALKFLWILNKKVFINVYISAIVKRFRSSFEFTFMIFTKFRLLNTRYEKTNCSHFLLKICVANLLSFLILAFWFFAFFIFSSSLTKNFEFELDFRFLLNFKINATIW